MTSIIRYIDIDSTHRNRSSWPNPGRFDVITGIKQPGSTPISSVDSVSQMAPISEWQSNRFDPNIAGSSSIDCEIISTGFGATNTAPLIIFKGANGFTLQTAENYYSHAVITASVAASQPTIEARVLFYQYLGNNTGKIVLMSSANLSTGMIFSITDPTDLSLGRIFIPSSPYTPNFYASLMLYNETLSEQTPILNFDELTGTVTISVSSPTIAGWTTTDSFCIRKTNSAIQGTVAGGSTTSNLNLMNISESATMMEGSYIRIMPLYPASAPSSEMRCITAYTKRAFPGSAANVTIFPPLSAVPSIGMKYEILQWFCDIYQPLRYQYSRQSSELTTCTIRLSHIVLPNKVMSTLGGGRISNQPYIYVTLTPINATSLTNTIISNNPNSSSMMFKALRQISDDFVSDDFVFARFSGEGMSQKVKFRIDGNYLFHVTLPNGQTFETEQKDTTSPKFPNPALQITAMFELELSSSEKNDS